LDQEHECEEGGGFHRGRVSATHCDVQREHSL
jgi:hypothetical protein